MIDPVSVQQYFLCRTDDRFAVGARLGNQMGGQEFLPGAGLPDMEIVHFQHAVERQQVVSDFDEIDAGRDGVEEGIASVPGGRRRPTLIDHVEQKSHDHDAGGDNPDDDQDQGKFDDLSRTSYWGFAWTAFEIV